MAVATSAERSSYREGEERKETARVPAWSWLSEGKRGALRGGLYEISLAYLILGAVGAVFLALMATFLRLMVEDWEAAEIDIDEIERRV